MATLTWLNGMTQTQTTKNRISETLPIQSMGEHSSMLCMGSAPVWLRMDTYIHPCMGQ
jgi:hypothetical protein